MGVDNDLWAAANDGNCDKLLASLKARANVNTISHHGRTPLSIASQNGHYDICQILLEYGANVNACTKHGVTPLHQASLQGYEKLVRLLLENGANLNLKTKIGANPLHLVSKKGHLPVLDCLLSHGADVNAVGINGNTALHYAAWAGYKDMVHCLLRNGAEVDIWNFSMETPAMYAATNEQYEIVRIIETSRLYNAAFHGRYERFKELLESETLPNLMNIFEASNVLNPIKTALEGGHSNIAQLIFQSQFDINYDNTIKELPAICFAIERGHDEVVSYMLDCGADPDASANGESILHLATQKRNTNLVNLLLLKGANPNITDGRGFTALHYAVTNGDERIVSDLLEHNANVNAVTPNRETALHVAFAGIHYKIGQLLVRKGADIEAKNDDNETPLNVLNRKWSDYQIITIMMSKPTGSTIVEEISNCPLIDLVDDNQDSASEVLNNVTRLELKDMAVEIKQLGEDTMRANEPLINLEQKNDKKDCNSSTTDLVNDIQDSVSDVSDSDATVAYPSVVDLSDFSEQTQEAVQVLQFGDIENLQSKMDYLIALILQVKDMAVGLNQLRMDLLRETETVENLQRRMDNNRRLRELKTKNSHDKTKYEETLKALTEKQEQAKSKESELKEEIETNQTNFRELKAKIKIIHRELGKVV